MTRMLKLPRLGETMEEGRIVRWLKQPGDSYRRGEILLEVETDKTTVEVPALEDGALIAHLAEPGAMVPVEAPIASIAGEAEAAPMPKDRPVAATGPASPAKVVIAPGPQAAGLRASPAARRIARDIGVDLATVTGTGRQGRIQGWDIAARAPAAPSPFRSVAPMERSAALAVRRWPVERQSGPTLALIHGFGGDSAGFDRLARALNARGRSALAVDLPAHGESSALSTDLPGIAKLIAETLAPEGPIHLVGHSLGGALATMASATLRPQAISLIAPVGFGPIIAQGFLDGLAQAETAEAIAALLAMTTRDALRYTPAILAGVVAQLSDPSVRAARSALVRAIADKGRQRLDLRETLAAVEAPTTLILGLHDAVIPTNGLVEGLPLTAQHLIDAGHMPHLEATRAVATILTRV